MKKCALLLLAICCSIGSYAQLSFSPIIGGNLSNVKLDYPGANNITPVLRHHLGIQAKYDITTKFGIGLGLQYATKGYKVHDEFSSNTAELQYNYFEAIPFAEYKPFKQIGILLGGSFGALTGTSTINDGSRPINPEEFAPNDLDIGMVAGLRFYFKNLFVGLAYNRSLAPSREIIYIYQYSSSISVGKEFNKNILFSLGYNLHLKKNTK